MNYYKLGHTLVFYIPNDFSTIGDVPFNFKNSVLAPTKELHLQTCIMIAFWYILCIFLTNHWRLQHYHTPNNSPATKDASFHVKNSRKVTVYKL